MTDEEMCEDCGGTVNVIECDDCGKVVCQSCAEAEGEFCRCFPLDLGA